MGRKLRCHAASWASTIFLHRDRPRPAPPWARLRELSTGRGVQKHGADPLGDARRRVEEVDAQFTVTLIEVDFQAAIGIGVVETVLDDVGEQLAQALRVGPQAFNVLGGDSGQDRDVYIFEA